MQMKLAIKGSRLSPTIDIEQYLKYIHDTIVSCGAKGAGTYAREFAKKKGQYESIILYQKTIKNN